MTVHLLLSVVFLVFLVNGEPNSEEKVVCVDGCNWETVCNNREKLARVYDHLQGLCQKGDSLATQRQRSKPMANGNCTFQNCQDMRLLDMSCTDASCDCTVDLGVVYHAFEALYDEIQSQCSSSTDSTTTRAIENDTTTSKESMNPTSKESMDTMASATSALGAVIGLLVVVLMVGAVGWIVTCVKLSRCRQATISVTNNESTGLSNIYTEATPTQNSDSPVHLHYDMVGRTPTQTSNSHVDLTYEVIDEPTRFEANTGTIHANHVASQAMAAHSNGGSEIGATNVDDGTNDPIDRNQQAPPTVQPEPAHLTPVGASKKGDDFYDAEEHTYAVVNKRKEKTAKNKEERESPPVYNTAMSEEPSCRGVHEEEELNC